MPKALIDFAKKPTQPSEQQMIEFLKFKHKDKVDIVETEKTEST